TDVTPTAIAKWIRHINNRKEEQNDSGSHHGCKAEKDSSFDPPSRRGVMLKKIMLKKGTLPKSLSCGRNPRLGFVAPARPIDFPASWKKVGSAQNDTEPVILTGFNLRPSRPICRVDSNSPVSQSWAITLLHPSLTPHFLEIKAKFWVKDGTLTTLDGGQAGIQGFEYAQAAEEKIDSVNGQE
ncbi:hypothetical protein BaRGS_00016855, partial [Batillaria attramentaria]